MHTLVAATPVATGIDAHACAARPRALTRWDGNVAAVRDRVRSPATGDAVSATRLQQWAECPFRYLLANVLRVPVEDQPERLLELSPLERGTLVHEVLERFVRGGARPSRGGARRRRARRGRRPRPRGFSS